MKKNCSIYFYEGYIQVAPTIINLTFFLNTQGYFVKIYTRKTLVSASIDLGKNTQIIYFRQLQDVFLISKIIKILFKFKLLDLIELLEAIFWLFQFFLHPAKSAETLKIGVDTNGSILALLSIFFLRKKTPIIYLSLELNEPKQYIAFTINKIERIVYKQSACIIIQDLERFKTISKYNNYKHPKVFYLPNSPISIEKEINKNNDRINFFREKFNLNKIDFPCIILQAGMIGDITFSKVLAQSFQSIENKGYALIFHERIQRCIDDPYIRDLKKINSKNLFLSLEPLPYEEIDIIFASATIGLAFYQDIDNNFSEISMASGKLAYYLKHGKPVLVNNLESLSRLVKKYQIGLVVQDPANCLELETAIKVILNNYNYYSTNAKQCYDSEYSWSNKIPLLFDFIEQL
jgi:hypothetical protein